MKQRVLGFQKLSPSQAANEQKENVLTPPRPTHKRGASSGAILVSPIKKDTVFSDSVYYIGKVNLVQQQAPPQFIDKVLIHLKKMSNETLQMPPANQRKKRFSLDVGVGNPPPGIVAFFFTLHVKDSFQYTWSSNIQDTKVTNDMY